ncbi:zinc finger domain-containing protein [Nocardia cyriacigeorgica]|uniref:zinc finger domain-containing protein n=1 Tax=Nocardia cyriacigeorgica TaxID=135487 RepID=UPI002458A443|nr:hypothetical protein [Nocardia cyriacigeorgica]
MPDHTDTHRPMRLSARDIDQQRAALKVACPYRPCSAPAGEACTFVAYDGTRVATRLQHPARVNRARQENTNA